MSDARRMDARSSTTSPAPSAALRIVEIVRRGSLAVALLALVAASGWRWHEAMMAAPVRVTGGGIPSAVLVLQEGDCPDRRAAARDWLARARREHAAGSGVAVAWVGDPPLTGPEWTRELPRLAPPQSARAANALLRLGAEGTPALLLLDASGVALIGDTFAVDGPGPRLESAVRMLGSVGSSLDPASPTPEIDGWNR